MRDRDAACHVRDDDFSVLPQITQNCSSGSGKDCHDFSTYGGKTMVVVVMGVARQDGLRLKTGLEREAEGWPGGRTRRGEGHLQICVCMCVQPQNNRGPNSDKERGPGNLGAEGTSMRSGKDKQSTGRRVARRVLRLCSAMGSTRSTCSMMLSEV